jgi:hypothetical protein
MSQNRVPWESDYNIYLKYWEPGQLSPTLNCQKKSRNRPNSHIESLQNRNRQFSKNKWEPPNTGAFLPFSTNCESS